jgi:tetraacyldisaccharide 4'-kinase
MKIKYILTAPLSHAYAAAVNTRNFLYDKIPALSKSLRRPVISVGGIRAGGVGKTPVAQFIGQYIIEERGYGVAFLSRGYGRLSRKPVVVRPNEDADWEQTGDEPSMLHANLPESWLGIGADRAALAKKLSPLLPEKSVFILDDGFQRRQARRDLDIVCLSESAFCDRMMPAGYLREPTSSLARADIVLIIGSEGRIDKLREVKEIVERQFKENANIYKNSSNTATNANINNNNTGITANENVIGKNPYKSCQICAILLQYPHSWVNGESGEAADSAPLKNPAVVCGIARPERFVDMVRSFSMEPSGIYSFRDHHNFKRNDFLFAHDIYYSGGVVTTEKDFVRLRAKKFVSLRELWYLKVGLRFSDPDSEARVKSKINGITL